MPEKARKYDNVAIFASSDGQKGTGHCCCLYCLKRCRSTILSFVLLVCLLNKVREYAYLLSLMPKKGRDYDHVVILLF